VYVPFSKISLSLLPIYLENYGKTMGYRGVYLIKWEFEPKEKI
jgi:hypothetical protein